MYFYMYLFISAFNYLFIYRYNGAFDIILI